MIATVPYRSQWDWDANWFRRDCGPACVAMAVEAIKGERKPINTFAASSSLANGATGLTCAELVTLLQREGLKSSVKIIAPGKNELVTWAGEGKLVIALVNYGLLNYRMDVKFTGGHFVLIVGMADEATMLVHDPDFWGSRRDEGGGIRVSLSELEKAIYASPGPGKVVLIDSGLATSPVKTKYVAAPAGLNVRQEPAITAAKIGALPFRARVETVGEPVAGGDLHWSRLVPKGYAASKYLTDVAPSDEHVNKIGLHIHLKADMDTIMRMARAGLLAGATCLEEGVANALKRAGVPWVVFRRVGSENDPHPPIQGNEADWQRGWDWYYSDRLYAYTRQLDRGIFVQIANEQNYQGPGTSDGWFYLGAMAAAEKDGRRLVIFNDGVGHPADSVEVNGQVRSRTWDHRIDVGCLRHAKLLGHAVGYHSYGPQGRYPGSAPGAEDQWRWHGGGVLSRYAATPEDSRPMIFLTEAGTYEAAYMGEQFTWMDMQGYQSRLSRNPYVKMMCYWTAGAVGDKLFDYSSLDRALPFLELRLLELKARGWHVT